MVFGWDDAAMLALSAVSAGGGIMGKKRKHIDPEMLRQKFGPGAVSKDTLELANYILNSPHGQKLLASAAESGQQFQNNVNANAASSGLAGPGGSSGTGVFATSAGSQAQGGFERAIKGDIYQAAMPVAAQGVADRQAAYIADLQGGGYQDDRARMAQGIGQAASLAGSILPKGAPAGAGATAPTGNMNLVAAPATAAENSLGIGANDYIGHSPTAGMLAKRAKNRSFFGYLNGGNRNVRTAYPQPAM